METSSSSSASSSSAVVRKRYRLRSAVHSSTTSRYAHPSLPLLPSLLGRPSFATAAAAALNSSSSSSSASSSSSSSTLLLADLVRHRSDSLDASASSASSSELDIDTGEIFYLMARFLATTSCERAFHALVEEADAQGLFSRIQHWTGDVSPLTFAQMHAAHHRLPADYLARLLQKLAAVMNATCPGPVIHQKSLLGTGANSLLRDRPTVDVPRPPPSRNLALALLKRKYAVTAPPSSVPMTAVWKHYEKAVQFAGHLFEVYCVIFDRSGHRIISGSDDFLVKIWSTSNGRLIHTLRGHENVITDLAVSHDNQLLASSSMDKFVRVWSLRAGTPVAVLPHKEYVATIDFSPSPHLDRQYLMSTGGCTSQFWKYTYNAETGNYNFSCQPVVYKCRMNKKYELRWGRFNAAGTRFVTSSSDGIVRLYVVDPNGVRRKDGETQPILVPHLERMFGLELEGHFGSISVVAFSHCGDRILSGSYDGTARIWKHDAKSKNWASQKLEPFVEDFTGSRPKITMVAWTRDDCYVITALGDNTIRIWNSLTCKELFILKEHTGTIYVVDPHPTDRSILLTAGYDGVAILWDTRRGQILRKYTEQCKFLEGGFSPDGMSFVLSDNGGKCYYYRLGFDADAYRNTPGHQFFIIDYARLRAGAASSLTAVLEEANLAYYEVRGPVCDSSGTPYGPPYDAPFDYGLDLPVDIPDEYASHVAEAEAAEEEDSKRLLQQYPAGSADETEIQSYASHYRRQYNRMGVKFIGSDSEQEEDWDSPSDEDFREDNAEDLSESSDVAAAPRRRNRPTSHHRNATDRMRRRTVDTDEEEEEEEEEEEINVDVEGEEEDGDGEEEDSDEEFGHPRRHPRRRQRQRPGWRRDRRKGVVDSESDPDVDIESESEFDTKVRAPKSIASASTQKKKKMLEPASVATIFARFPDEWVQQDVPSAAATYFPQIGDSVVYLRSGHEQAAKMMTAQEGQGSADSFDVDLGAYIHGDEAVVRCEVVGVEFHVGVKSEDQKTWCMLSLRRKEAALSDEPFAIPYFDLDSPDFIVLESLFDVAMASEPPDRNASVEVPYKDGTYKGTMVSRRRQSDPWGCYTIRWDAEGTEEQISPWELTQEGFSPPSIPNEENQRYIAIIRKVMEEERAQEFIQPVDFREYYYYCNVIPVPMCFELILRRLSKKFYRRVEAVIWDVNTIRTNAEIYNEPGSVILEDVQFVVDQVVSDLQKASQGGRKRSRAYYTNGEEDEDEDNDEHRASSSSKAGQEGNHDGDEATYPSEIQVEVSRSRGRGRPRKIAVTNAGQTEEDILFVESPHARAAPSQAVSNDHGNHTTPQKRHRGRPRLAD